MIHQLFNNFSAPNDPHVLTRRRRGNERCRCGHVSLVCVLYGRNMARDWEAAKLRKNVEGTKNTLKGYIYIIYIYI